MSLVDFLDSCRVNRTRCSCTWTYSREVGEGRFWLQHGDNPEARVFFDEPLWMQNGRVEYPPEAVAFVYEVIEYSHPVSKYEN